MPLTPSPTPHLLWARPVSQLPLFISLHTYTFLLPALHSLRLCNQYGYSASTLLPPISRLPPSIMALIERHLITAHHNDALCKWTRRLEAHPPCERCQPTTTTLTREEELRRKICKCRLKFKRDLDAAINRLFVCGRDVWDSGDDGKGKLTTGQVLRRFCGLELFVEGAGGLWLCLPFVVEGQGEKGRLGIGGGYTRLGQGMVGRFRFAVDTLGMRGDPREGRKLEHWGMGDLRGGDGCFGVELMLFSAGFVVA